MNPSVEPFVAVPMLGAATHDATGVDGRPAQVGERPNGRHRSGRVDGGRENAPPVDGTNKLTRRIATPDREVLGPLAPYAADGVTDLLVNGTHGFWADAGGRLERLPPLPLDEAGVRELAVRLVARGGRHVDDAHPCVDVRIGRGIRVHVVLAPISAGGTLISVRIPRSEPPDLESLVGAGMLTPESAAELRGAVGRRENLLITGAAGAGKTTLLAALLAEAPPLERIITVEDVAELRIDHPHVVSLEARQANIEGAGGIGLADLVREAMRMRPDRLVVGECRGAEVRELLTALNTGHDGGAGTLHANSLADVPARLEALGALAGLSDTALARQVVSAIGLVVHVQRDAGVRRVDGRGRFTTDALGRLAIVEAG